MTTRAAATIVCDLDRGHVERGRSVRSKFRREYDGAEEPVTRDARACWLRSPGRAEIRPVTLPDPGPGEVRVRSLYSGISRGTETLVFRGGVPPGQYAAMRAPFQQGDFPGPVKYGYLNVGVVEEGPPALLDRT